MFKTFFTISLISLSFSFIPYKANAQKPGEKPDTFFLARKKGILGRLGKSIATQSPDRPLEKVENNFIRFRGKVIRFIDIVRLGFENNIYDTDIVKKGFGIRIAKVFHKNTRENVIYHNLFFREGDNLSPYLLADNERYLRELIYLQDARILVDFAEDSRDSVDVVVITKDVFSMGGKIAVDSKDKGRLEWKEENLDGTGNRLSVSSFYEKQRKPRQAFGAEMVKRNIKGSFIDWTTGFQNFKPAFNSGRNEETTLYTALEKPLVTPYIPSTGALQAAYFRTSNNYLSDSLYNNEYKYAYYNLDGWLGYSLDSKRSLYAHKEIRMHRFVALRGFLQRFFTVPDKSKTVFDYRYTDTKGLLASLNIFKQIFYKTNFIYGFGRSEDVPEGFSVAFTGGIVNEQNIKRPYAGIDAGLTSFKRNKFHSNFTFRIGGFYNSQRFEDLDMLFQVEHFTGLRKLSPTWYLRSFITTSITGQVNPVLNTPLFLNSNYGLDYFNNGSVSADMRTTFKGESVFYNTHKILGFRFAPFIFGDMSLLKPSRMGLSKSDLFSAVGAGVRTRNENLIFGTIELKAYFIPRKIEDMPSWKVELSSNIRFKYITTFIKRPDFILAN